MLGVKKTKQDKANIKVRTLTSFVFDGWRILVMLLYNVSDKTTHLQVSTLLGHLPLIPDGTDQRGQLIALLQHTATFGRCRMMVNDRQMIFLLAQKQVKPLILKSPPDLICVTSELLLEARPLLGVYKRFLVSE